MQRAKSCEWEDSSTGPSWRASWKAGDVDGKKKEQHEVQAWRPQVKEHLIGMKCPPSFKDRCHSRAAARELQVVLG